MFIDGPQSIYLSDRVLFCVKAMSVHRNSSRLSGALPRPAPASLPPPPADPQDTQVTPHTKQHKVVYIAYIE